MTRPHWLHYVRFSTIVSVLMLLVAPATAGAAPPVLTVPGPQAVNEGAALHFGVSAVDPEGQHVEFRASGVPLGATFVDHRNNTGSFDWTPAHGDAGAYSVTIVADDTFGGTDTRSVAIDVTAVNTPPVLGPLPDRVMDPGTIAILSIWANDDDGDPLTFTASGLPAYGEFTDYGGGSAGIVLSPPSSTPGGTFSITVTVSDGQDTDWRSFSVTITGGTPGTPPSLSSIGDLAVAENGERVVEVHAEDADGDALTWTSSLPSFARLFVMDGAPGQAGARLELAPGGCDAGDYPSWVAVSDGAFVTEERFTIHVSDLPRPPRWTAPTEGATVRVVVAGDADVLLAGVDPDQECDGPAPTFTLMGNDAEGALALSIVPGQAGQATLRVHAVGPAGEYHVTVRLLDGDGGGERYVDRTFAVVATDVARTVDARAWTRPKQIHLWLGSRWQRFYLEPGNGTGDAGRSAGIDPASVRVWAWEGAGTGSGAAAAAERRLDGTDTDQNGVPEFRFDVMKTDLKAIFANLTEPTDGEITVTAMGLDGVEVRATFQARVIPDKKRAIKRCGPNPLNPEATVEVVTAAEGRLRVMVFDVSGRMVRVLAEESNAPAGSREVRFNGHDDRGRRLRAGRYFVRVESVHGTEATQLTILP
jgi:hypothetical protein